MSNSIEIDELRDTPRILILLTDHGLDPTAVAKPWEIFQNNGYIVEFATENGNVAKPEQRVMQRSWFRGLMVSLPFTVAYDLSDC